MAKYLVTSDSYFRPFSYDELVKPIAHMQEVHNATQDAYDQLSMETSALKNYITDNPDDAQAKAMYDAYTSKLESLQNNLWENGVSSKTRQDLSAARKGYFSDITRLSNAIKTRQERSKAFWDMKHNHPDLITSDDPGLSGLDNYLNDANYGQNFYAYSGESFMKEVGTDAQARADEMLRDPKVVKNPALVGYLQEIQQNGFTSTEVKNAGAAVKAAMSGDDSLLKQLDPASSILANVLMSHIDSTGASGKVNADELNRLFDYGMAGLSSAIGKTTITNLSDKQWDYNKQMALASMKASAKKGNGSGLPYTLNDVATYMKGKDADKILGTMYNKFDKPFEKPIMVTGTDGRPDIITNPMDAERILASTGRDDIVRMFGINPDRRRAQSGTYVDENGTSVKIKVRNDPTNNVGEEMKKIVYVQNSHGDYIKDAALSDKLNNMLTSYTTNRNQFQRANPDVDDIRKLAISGKYRDKIYKEHGFPDDMPLDDAYAAMQTLAKEGYVTAATIADPTMGKTLDRYEGLIMTQHAGEEKDGGGRVPKTSDFAFYTVDDYEISDKAERKNGRKISDVLPKRGTLTGISAMPEDIIQNRVRIQTALGKTYAINPVMLGNNLDATVRNMRPAVTEVMKPITDPVSALQMSPDDATNWIYYASMVLGDYMRFDKRDAQGNLAGFITPRDIVYDTDLQEMLRTAVTMYMNNMFGDARDMMMLNNYQVHGDTSEKAVGYNDYLE